MSDSIINLSDVRKARGRERLILIEVVVDPCKPLEKNGLIAWSQRGFFPKVNLSYWLGSTGRDHGGRFAKRGSKYEQYLLDFGATYCADTLQRGLQIHGAVVSARVADEFDRDSAS